MHTFKYDGERSCFTIFYADSNGGMKEVTRIYITTFNPYNQAQDKAISMVSQLNGGGHTNLVSKEPTDQQRLPKTYFRDNTTKENFRCKDVEIADYGKSPTIYAHVDYK